MADADKPSADEVKAQREAKKAAKAAKAAAAKAKKEGGAVPEAAAVEADAPADERAEVAAADEPSAEEVRAQREAKKAAKAAKVAAAKAKQEGGAAASGSTPAAAPPAASSSPAPAKPAAKAAAPAAASAAPAVEAIAVKPNPAKPPPALPPCDVSYEFAQLGLMCRSLRLVGANARTLGMLQALGDLVKRHPRIQELTTLNSETLEVVLGVVNANVEFLNGCRSLTAGMEFVTRVFRERLRRTSDRQGVKLKVSEIAKRHVADITAETLGAMSELSNIGASCIKDGDVILTFGRCSSIENAFALAAGKAVDFTVIVVDSAPLYEGRGLQWRLQQRGIKTCYVLLTSVCATMANATRVFIGAASILQNGQVVGRAGTAVVSLVAKEFRKPLLCFCETYKYTERIWRTTNAVATGAGLADGAVPTLASAGGSASQAAGVQAARYDTSPKELVDNIVSEIGFLHPTAIAAAIRDRDERETRASDPF